MLVLVFFGVLISRGVSVVLGVGVVWCCGVRVGVLVVFLQIMFFC